MKTKSRVLFTSLILVMLLTLLTGIALASTLFHVKHASLDDHQDACLDSGGVSTYWHFVITQIDLEEDVPDSINVVWDNGFDVDVPLLNYTGKTAHYETSAYPGWLVTDATAWLPDDWSGQFKGAGNGQFNLSHVICTTPIPLDPSKTADPSFTRDWTWEIDKEEDGSYVGFTGDSWVHNYLVTVTPTSTDNDWEVNGTITIVNPNPFGVFVLIDDSVDNGGDCVLDATSASVPATGQVEVDYTCTWSSEPSPLAGTNTATITWGQLEYPATASFDFAITDPTETGYPIINVDDSWYGDLGSADREEASFGYERTFTCDEDEDEGEHINTATINETGQNDDATVNVDCYALEVSKTADTSFTRTYVWSIDKSADYSALTLATGETFTTVTYDIVLDAYYIDSDWAVEGSITVHNPAPIAATINSVSDYVSGDEPIPADVDCGVDFPYELAAGGTLECTYNVELPNANARTNSATANLQNTPSGTTDFSGYANVSFTEATIDEIDECVNVEDSYAGTKGTVCYADLPESFTYTRDIGPYEVCGEYTVYNLATALTNDTETLISDDWTVDVTVPCEGCTLTQGYWKTHSSLGPAPYDDNWAGREFNTFYLSGKTWYQVFWTPPAGNAYYNLAHQYMAAKLNIWNGASSTTAVNGAIVWAESFFSTYNPIAKVSKSDKAAVILNAGILGSYNEGLIGPGHCSE